MSCIFPWLKVLIEDVLKYRQWGLSCMLTVLGGDAFMMLLSPSFSPWSLAAAKWE